MLNFYRIICVLFCVEIFATSLPAEAVADSFAFRVKGISQQIRDASNEEERFELASSLFNILNDVNPGELVATDTAIYERAAYGLFLKFPNLSVTHSNLKRFQEMSQPKINEGLAYIEMLDGRLVVVEKLTLENLESWNKYAQEEYLPYIRLPNYQVMQEEMDDGPEKESYAHLKYRHDISGIQYFSSIIGAGLKSYDKWIAYVYRGSLEQLLQKKSGTFQPDNIEMVMTLQVQGDLYSPMGISRTVSAAKRMHEQETKGKEPKFTPHLSIWFQVLCGKMIQKIYGVNCFWSRPVATMSRLLIRALFPNAVLPDINNSKAWWGIYITPPEYLTDKVSLSMIPPECPWVYSTEFRAGSSIKLEVAYLLNAIFP